MSCFMLSIINIVSYRRLYQLSPERASTGGQGAGFYLFYLLNP